MDLARSIEVESDLSTGGPRKFSSRLYGINWEKLFPLPLTDEIEVRVGSWEEAMAFHQATWGLIYKEEEYNSSFLGNEKHPAKDRFYKEAGDFFLFCKEEQVVGVFTGTPIDWSSYYLRNCSILPEFQGQRLYQKFLKHLLDILAQHSVHRAEGDVSPANLGHIHVLNKFQFNITGQWMSERWGALLHFTKFLEKRSEAVFLEQFCHGIRPQIEKKSGTA